MAGPFLSPDETSALYGSLSAPQVAPSIDGGLLRQQLMGGPPQLDPGAMVRQRLAPTPLPMEQPPPERAMQSLTRDTPADQAAIAQPVAGPPSPPVAPPASSRFAGVGMGGGSLQKAVNEDRAQQLGTIQQQQALVGDQGAARAGRIMAVSEEEAAQATQMREDAAWDHATNTASLKKLAEYREANARRADEIAQMAPDPGRLMRNADAKTQFAMAIAAVGSGMLSALNGGPNEFFARLDRAIDRDIEAQNAAISNKKASLAEHRAIYGQMFQEFGDARMAANEHRAALYKAAQLHLKAKTDAYGIPEARAESEIAQNLLQQKYDALKLSNDESALQAYQRQMAAAAARQRQAEKDAQEMAFKWAELGIKRDEATGKLLETQGKRGADTADRFVATGKDAEGNPTGYVARSIPDAAKKEAAIAAAQKSLRLIDQAIAIRKEQGAGRIIRGSPLYTPEWRAALDDIRTELQLQKKDISNLGTLDKGSVEFLDRKIPDLDSIFGKSDEDLTRMRDLIQGGLDADSAASGARKAVKQVDPRTGEEVVVRGEEFLSPGQGPRPPSQRGGR